MATFHKDGKLNENKFNFQCVIQFFCKGNRKRIFQRMQVAARKGKLPYSIGLYTFIEQIGHGGFSEVYKVTHRTFKNYFVAKAMRTDPSETESKWEVFEAEVKALSALSHPNIIRLYDHFKQGNQFYLVLEYCPNGSLHDESMAQGGIKVSRFYELGREIVEALAYCHKNGVAHRDIKPGNVLLDPYYRAKIADFGLCAKTNAEELTENFGGSLSFLAPEIFQKKPHNAMMADVWALGVTFATILMARTPWNSDSLGGLKKLIASAKFRLSHRIPDILQDLIKKMIVVEPTERLTMQEILNHPFFSQAPPVPRKFSSAVITKSSFSLIKYETDKKDQPTRATDSFLIHAAQSNLILESRFHPTVDTPLTSGSDDILTFA
ncbi:CAMK family protein kinase [Tritrichomonas foetus]|uniref:CAMK family protein kinase n=1 Tax=Tritrichomonas foetus TaxID=1144522 RepID=A0A1J4JSR9_9EUKA|nr:CAMK family protein kinase [Tritrichomonas foetus]|eukprot:OHT01802.1 CAMK family protein kinase [Tritrichomonas foetus]